MGCFFLNAHIQVYEKKTATTTKTLTCGQEIFSSKKQTKKKTCSSKSLGFSSDDTHQKIDPKKPIPPPPKKYKNPVFTAMYPLMIQFFLTRTTKKYQQKKDNSFFQFCLFLKKREKNLKEKNPSELLYKALMTTFLITLTINMR